MKEKRILSSRPKEVDDVFNIITDLVKMMRETVGLEGDITGAKTEMIDLLQLGVTGLCIAVDDLQTVNGHLLSDVTALSIMNSTLERDIQQLREKLDRITDPINTNDPAFGLAFDVIRRAARHPSDDTLFFTHEEMRKALSDAIELYNIKQVS